MSANLTYQQLEAYIREQMRMSHVYQPVMLRVLLEKGGAALVTARRGANDS
jgi:ATP adenylyltransferase